MKQTTLHQSIQQSTGEKQTTIVGKKKQRYRIRNWKQYNETLVNRGSIFFWIDQAAQDNWNSTPTTGKRGRPKFYSDIAIETCLTLKNVFSLRLRSVEGFVNSLFSIMKVALVSPDYSTLSVRQGKLSVDIHPRQLHKKTNEAVHIVVDSSGAKVYGEGEWKVRQHGWGKHRTWRKFHLGINEATGVIEAAELTGNNVTDADMLKPLLQQIQEPINQVSADGAYDRRKCYDILSKLNIRVAIPPQKNANIWRHGNRRGKPHARDENLRMIRMIGRKQWKKEVNFHRRSLAENTVFRFKTIFGDTIASRLFGNQRTEVLLKCKILNQMALAGMPDSYLVE